MKTNIKYLILSLVCCFNLNAKAQTETVSTIEQLTNISGSTLNPVSSLIREVPVGCGFNNSEMQPILTNSNAFSIKDTTFSGLGDNIAVRGFIVDNYSNYYQSQDINVNGAAKYVSTSGSLSLNCSYQNDFSSNKFYLSLEFVRITKLTTLKNSTLSKPARSLLRGKDKTNFIQQYGDQYVYAIVRGNSLKITFEFDASQGGSVSNISADASASFQGVATGGKFSVDFSNTISNEFKNKSLKYTIDSRGFSYDADFIGIIFSDFTNVQSHISDYLKKQVGVDESVPLYVFTRNYDKKTALPPYNLGFLSDAVNAYQEITSEDDNLEDAIKNPDITKEIKESFHLSPDRLEREDYLIDLSQSMNQYLINPNLTNEKSLVLVNSKADNLIQNYVIPPVPTTTGNFTGNVPMFGTSAPVVLRNLTKGKHVRLTFTYSVCPGTTVLNGQNFETHTRLDVNGSTVYEPGDRNQNNSNNCMTENGTTSLMVVPDDGIFTCIIENARTLINGSGSSIILSGSITVVTQ